MGCTIFNPKTNKLLTYNIQIKYIKFQKKSNKLN